MNDKSIQNEKNQTKILVKLTMEFENGLQKRDSIRGFPGLF